MKSLYTFNEIIDKINSNDYNAEMMLQHLIVRYKELEKERDEARQEVKTIIKMWVPINFRKSFFSLEKGGK